MDKITLEAMRAIVTKHAVASDRLGSSASVLDVGSMDCGSGSLKPIVLPAWTYVGIDMREGPNVDVVVKDPNSWPELPSDEFDIVMSSSCLEHAEQPWTVMREKARVCKPGGLIFMSMPSRGHYHPYPIDCWRFMPDGMRALAKWANLNVLELTSDGHEEWENLVCAMEKPA